MAVKFKPAYDSHIFAPRRNFPARPRGTPKGGSHHAYHQEFTIRLDDRPGTLGKLCQALAEQDVNILAYQQFSLEKGKGSVRLVVDNPDKTRAALDSRRSDYAATEVAKVTLTNRARELARVAPRLGNEGININYGYSPELSRVPTRLS